MSTPFTVLVAEPDARLRALLVSHLSPLGCTVLEAADGVSAYAVACAQPVNVVLTELYLETGKYRDLIQAIRDNKSLRRTRAVAHTRYATATHREWATSAGADAFLLYPTRAERLRYVVSRLADEKGARVSAVARKPILRRVSLDQALVEFERGELSETPTVVVGRDWWHQLTPSRQSGYRKRAKSAGVTLRSDSLLSDDYVVVRSPSRSELALPPKGAVSPKRAASPRVAASPYKGQQAR